jgi:peptidoglycan/LPS O-acetylase OafA/YrhL
MESTTGESRPRRDGPGALLAAVGGRIPQLDGLRGIAIGLVVVWHYFVEVPGHEASGLASLLRRLFFLSWSGVDLFFVLSGFLIGGILLDNRESPRYFRTFYVRRAFRIIPLYVLLLVPFWSARASLDTSRSPALAALLAGDIPSWSYAAFLQNFFMANAGHFGPQWTAITWSLAVEEQFYLVLPLTLYLVPRRHVPRLCLACAAAALGLRTTLVLAGTTASATGAAYLLLPSRMDALLLGVLGAWLVRDPAWRRRLEGSSRALWLVIAVAGAGVAVASFRETYFSAPVMATVGYSWLAVLYFAALIACVAADAGPLRAVTTAWPLRALGQVSYFVYLFHTLVLLLVHFQLFGRMPAHHSLADALATLAALALLLGAATLSWRFLEEPLIREGRRARY